MATPEPPIKKAKSEEELENPFLERHDDSDVIMIVEDTKLHVHSAVLKTCSPIFKAMLDEQFMEGQSKEINMPGKKLKNVIELLKHFYPKYGAKLRGD